MLKKKAIRKIMITTFSFIVIYLICVIPGKINDNYLNPKIDTIYVNNVGTNEIYLLGDNNYLIKTNVILSDNSIEDKVRDIINYLTINKSSRIPNGLSGVIPSDTILNSVTLDNGTIILDFSESLLDTTLELEDRVIEAIVYSLINIDGIDSVKININGNILTMLPNSKKVLPQVFTREYGINKVFDIDNIYNTKKVIMYYIDKIDNNNYYVPVTKYVSDDREKIKIIIDNLSSNFIHESSLLSFLKQDIELLNYEIDDDTMRLNFNQNLFDNNKILEEVIYSISNSVFDNYDVNRVVFQVNDINTIEINR